MKLARLAFAFASMALCFVASSLAEATKPIITIEEFFNSTDFHRASFSPDGTSIVIPTSSPDWQHDRFREDLWLWRQQTGKLLPLTQSGHDSDAQWSPDGKYVAFISDRALPGEEEGTERIWLIDPTGGEAFPLYRAKEDVHAFAWSHDGSTIYFAITEPQSKDEKEAFKSEWKDVIRWREQERGDVLLKVVIADAVAQNLATPNAGQKPPEPAASAIEYPRGTSAFAHTAYEIDEVACDPTGKLIAFNTKAISHRLETPRANEIYIVAAGGGSVRQLTHNEALESDLAWAPDGHSLYFLVRAAGGSVDQKYQDVQGRIYQIDPVSGAIERIGGEFKGSWEGFAVQANGKIVAEGELGTETQIYNVDGKNAKHLAGTAGTYQNIVTATRGGAILLTHSRISEPTEVYLADDTSHLASAKPLTTFNALFAQRATIEWKPFKWKADDGATVEGVLMYPPGKLDARNLRMFTFIHGGPADADGDRFGADWYDWAALAAARGWLVFRPNYRGSTGYGDEFQMQIEPHLVSRPGKDILEGVEALVKAGIADPDHLVIGGYSYGGYMTNWLITQTSQFKAAVTGAGAVEHAANWGNDDLTFDDAWYLSGTPWEKPDLYQAEAALFKFDKVKTPTHLVAGNADIRVSYFEGVLMERALQSLNIPHSFLVFPGEGHPLAKNPWHGYIKVREELKWLEKYGS